MATATRTVISDEEIERELATLDDNDRAKLNRFTRIELERMGYMSTREGGRTWEKAERNVIRHLLEREMRVRDVEERED